MQAENIKKKKINFTKFLKNDKNFKKMIKTIEKSFKKNFKIKKKKFN